MIKDKTSLDNRISEAKLMFQNVHENASNLHSEMEETIKAKTEQIKRLQEEINTIERAKKEIELFINIIL